MTRKKKYTNKHPCIYLTFPSWHASNLLPGLRSVQLVVVRASLPQSQNLSPIHLCVEDVDEDMFLFGVKNGVPDVDEDVDEDVGSSKDILGT